MNERKKLIKFYINNGLLTKESREALYNHLKSELEKEAGKSKLENETVKNEIKSFALLLGISLN